MDLSLFLQINYLAVLVAGILYFVLGALWYSPLLFAKPWMEAVGLSPQDVENASPVIYIYPLIFYLLAALISAFLIKALGLTALFSGLLLGIFGWLGYMLPAVGSSMIFEGRSMKLFQITAGYHLVGFLILGGLLTVWQ